jgi:hypothetical protein
MSKEYYLVKHYIKELTKYVGLEYDIEFNHVEKTVKFIRNSMYDYHLDMMELYKWEKE